MTPRGKKRAGRRETRCHAALGTYLIPDSPGLRGKEKSELYARLTKVESGYDLRRRKGCREKGVEKHREAKMIKYLKIMKRHVKKS